MKIDLVITELHPGGAERCCVELALHLRRANHHVRVVSLGPQPKPPRTRLIDLLGEAGIETHFLNGTKVSQFPGVRHRLRTLLMTYPPDVVQSFLWHANLLVASVYPAKQVPFVAGVRVVEPRRWRAWTARFWARKASRVVCVSDEVAQWCHATEHVPRDRIAVIPNGVEIPSVDDTNPLSWSVPGPLHRSEPILLFVGRLEPQKGVDQLMIHADSILHQLPAHRLVLIGEGRWKSQWQGFQGRSRYGSRIEVLGHRDDVSAWMARADLLLLPTRYEGMPNVVLEAMAHGLPIAVTRVEGVAHALGDGLASQSADRGDWAGWARLVVQLARDESQRKGIASANRARAMSEFSLPQMLSRYERLYQELLES